MARKREPRVPQVPRSNIRPSRVETGNVGEGKDGKRVPASLMGPRNISTEEFHEYVKGDLTRIAVFGSLIFGAMIALKFVVGL